MIGEVDRIRLEGIWEIKDVTSRGDVDKWGYRKGRLVIFPYDAIKGNPLMWYYIAQGGKLHGSEGLRVSTTALVSIQNNDEELIIANRGAQVQISSKNTQYVFERIF